MGIQLPNVEQLKAAYNCGREFILVTGGNYSLTDKEKALSFCDGPEERNMMRQGMADERADLKDIMVATGTY